MSGIGFGSIVRHKKKQITGDNPLGAAGLTNTDYRKSNPDPSHAPYDPNSYSNSNQWPVSMSPSIASPTAAPPMSGLGSIGAVPTNTAPLSSVVTNTPKPVTNGPVDTAGLYHPVVPTLIPSVAPPPTENIQPRQDFWPSDSFGNNFAGGSIARDSRGTDIVQMTGGDPSNQARQAEADSQDKAAWRTRASMITAANREKGLGGIR